MNGLDWLAVEVGLSEGTECLLPYTVAELHGVRIDAYWKPLPWWARLVRKLAAGLRFHVTPYPLPQDGTVALYVDGRLLPLPYQLTPPATAPLERLRKPEPIMCSILLPVPGRIYVRSVLVGVGTLPRASFVRATVLVHAGGV